MTMMPPHFNRWVMLRFEVFIPEPSPTPALPSYRRNRFAVSSSFLKKKKKIGKLTEEVDSNQIKSFLLKRKMKLLNKQPI